MESLLFYSFGFWIVIKVKSLSEYRRLYCTKSWQGPAVEVRLVRLWGNFQKETHQVRWSIHTSCFAHEQKSNHFVDQDLWPKIGCYHWPSYSKIVRAFEMRCILTVERALFVNCIIRPAYCTVVELSRVERIGIPESNDNFWTENKDSADWFSACRFFMVLVSH